jgi:hypothetical protein
MYIYIKIQTSNEYLMLYMFMRTLQLLITAHIFVILQYFYADSS